MSDLMGYGAKPIPGQLGGLLPDTSNKSATNKSSTNKSSTSKSSSSSSSSKKKTKSPTAIAVQSLQDRQLTEEGRSNTIKTAAKGFLANSAPVKKSPIDPLQAQLAFFQLVMPFLQQTIQQATGGMQQNANQYEQDMSGVVSNMPQSLQSIYGNVVPNAANAMRNEAGAQAQSALAMPEYSFMMQLVESLRAQQEEALQQQMMIQQLQSQLSQGGEASPTSSILDTILADAFKK